VATYLQWSRLFHGEKQELKRCTYLVGPDRILVEDIVDAIRKRVAPNDLDYAPVPASEFKPFQIFDALNQYPIDPRGQKLVVVRDCERIKDWKPVQEWLASRHIPQVVAVFIDSRHEVDTTQPHMASIIKSGRYVTCGPLNENDMYSFISSRCAIDPSDCRKLVERVGGDLPRAYDAARKAASLGARLDERAINILVSPSPSEEVEDALSGINKRYPRARPPRRRP
jgi:DNA polymerase III delta subunit